MPFVAVGDPSYRIRCAEAGSTYHVYDSEVRMLACVCVRRGMNLQPAACKASGAFDLSGTCSRGTRFMHQRMRVHAG